jgi:predicted dehydrogenase
VPIFADKPAANDAAEAADLASEGAESGVPVVVGYMKRFAGAYRLARDLIAKPNSAL